MQAILDDKYEAEGLRTAALLLRQGSGGTVASARLRRFTTAPPLTAAQREALQLRTRERSCSAAHRHCKDMFEAPVEAAGRSVFALWRPACSSASAWAGNPFGNKCLFNDACVACVDYSSLQLYLRQSEVLGALGGRSLALRRHVQARLGKHGGWSPCAKPRVLGRHDVDDPLKAGGGGGPAGCPVCERVCRSADFS